MSANPETVADGTVVIIQYTLRDGDGNVLDQSTPDDPLAYLHGADNIVPGLEKTLTGKAIGDQVKAEVAPEEGYGPHNPALTQVVPRSAFPAGADIQEGMQFVAESDDGTPMPIWITGIADEVVTVDGNHPLAGKTLHFDVEVTGLRTPTADETAHGHPHGVDGTADHHH